MRPTQPCLALQASLPISASGGRASAHTAPGPTGPVDSAWSFPMHLSFDMERAGQAVKKSSRQSRRLHSGLGISD